MRIARKSLKEPSFVRLQNRLRVLVELARAESSWRELIKSTNLNKNTLSSILRDLRLDGLIEEKVERQEGMGRPSIVYSLKPVGKKEVDRVWAPLVELEEIEQLIDEFSRLYLEEAAHSRKNESAFLSEYYGTLVLGVLAIFETELLRSRTDPVADNYLALQHLEAIRRVLWEKPFTRRIVKETRKELERDRNDYLEQIRLKIKALKAKT